MAQIVTYPTGTPKDGDYLIGTSVPPVNSDENPKTRNFSISSVLGLASTSYIKTQKTIVSTAELRTLNSPVKILINNPGTDKDILQVYGVVCEVTGNTATNKLVFPNDLEITNKSFVGVTPFKYVIPQAIANDTASAYFIPSLVAGETSFGAELVLQTAAAPTETGTAATTMTFWITYRIFNIQD
tara:strand:- start:889 stop:1443 length:555 start_codon:yes stop_codon:yes gene_type:complete